MKKFVFLVTFFIGAIMAEGHSNEEWTANLKWVGDVSRKYSTYAWIESSEKERLIEEMKKRQRFFFDVAYPLDKEFMNYFYPCDEALTGILFIKMVCEKIEALPVIIMPGK